MKYGNTLNFDAPGDAQLLRSLCRENAVESCKHLGIEFDEENYTLHWDHESVTWTYDAH
jgi:hypothetical protein